MKNHDCFFRIQRLALSETRICWFYGLHRELIREMTSDTAGGKAAPSDASKAQPHSSFRGKSSVGRLRIMEFGFLFGFFAGVMRVFGF
jgi:hypothetical protein